MMPYDFGTISRPRCSLRPLAPIGGALYRPALPLLGANSLPILVSAGCALVAAILILLLPKPAIIQDPGV